MHLRVFQFAARIRILVAAAAHHEQRRDVGMVLLEVFLRVPGVIAQPPEKAHRRIVAGITKHDRTQFVVVSVADTQHRYRMIDGPARIGMIAKSFV